MGFVEIIENQLIITSRIIIYGNAANPELAELIRNEIETMWNEPRASINFDDGKVDIVFKIESACRPGITDLEIFQNLDPANNYFRIEEFATGNISFVDGIGCNSGYFKLENLYKGSTTAAHEYGHTLGLEHPDDLNIRGKGTPGIMYPRGTLVDPEFQYEPDKPAGTKGGTLHPKFRKVLASDIEALYLQKLTFNGMQAIVGDFTNIWHPGHLPGEKDMDIIS
jgi:hypothetical protein